MGAWEQEMNYDQDSRALALHLASFLRKSVWIRTKRKKVFG